jgi:hypothetical protein
MKTAKEMLQSAIEAYNKEVNEISKFSLNNREVLMFIELLEEYAKQSRQADVIGWACEHDWVYDNNRKGERCIKCGAED